MWLIIDTNIYDHFSDIFRWKTFADSKIGKCIYPEFCTDNKWKEGLGGGYFLNVI